MENKILKSCDELFPEVIDFTREMVKQYAVLNREQAVLTVVEEHLTDLNFPVKRVSIDEALYKHSLYAPVEWDYENKYNLVSAINTGAKGKSLVLNGHLDVVPASPVDMWSQLPDIHWEKDGWLYGRGAGDMQSGVAAMIYAVLAIKHAGYKINSPLIIQTVIEEECSGNGTLACLDKGYTGDFVLIPEPFGPQIYSAQLGVIWFKLTVLGKPVHVLDTSDGNNAIEMLQSLLPFLKKLETQLNENFRQPPYDKFDHPFNLNIGQIKGGNWPSSVPAHAELEGRLGFPVGMTVNQIMTLLNDCIEQATVSLKTFKHQKPVLRFHGFRSEGHLIDIQNPGIQLLSNCHHHLTGQQPEHYISTCTTDLRAFHFYNKTAGTCYGPIAENIHGINERVNIESIRHTLKAYALFISQWCTIGK